MAETKTAGQKLKDELLMNDKNGWEELSEKEKKEILSFNDGYINFLNKGKTERECVKEAKEIAEANGFKEISKVKKLKAGDKVYEINRGKNIVLAVIGEEPIEKNYNKDRRIYRGLFQSEKGEYINADVNGSYQIMKKVFPKAFVNGIVDAGSHPVVVNIPLQTANII